MAVGFVLVDVVPGKEHEVFSKLIAMFPEVHLLFGDYDILVKVETQDTNEIGQIVEDKIRPVKGIIDIKTLQGIIFNKAP